jgi:hypothetical protein
VADFDPGQAEPVVSAEQPSSEERRMVTGPDTARRVEVRRDQRLTEVHELDADARVHRSVFLDPRDDGAVEVRYSRDEEGLVVRTQRLDRRGTPLP